jgi:hypothetical protein
VIWQLGLRGKADEAVWKADPSISSSIADRGAIISNAIRAQHDIICDVLNTEDFYSTATLWNEGSELYGKGYLKLPKNTIPVFSDFGLDQMFGDDFYTTRREADRKYGIYYHAGFWALGPHLTEGCNPEKMAYCYRDAAEKNNLYYSILNISNVRPLHISAIMNARIMSAPLSFSARDELFKLDPRDSVPGQKVFPRGCPSLCQQNFRGVQGGTPYDLAEKATLLLNAEGEKVGTGGAVIVAGNSVWLSLG